MNEANPYQPPREILPSMVRRNWLRPIKTGWLICGLPIFGVSCGLSLTLVLFAMYVIRPGVLPRNMFQAIGMSACIPSVLFLFTLPVLMVSNKEGRLTGRAAFKIVNGFGAVVITVLLTCAVSMDPGWSPKGLIPFGFAIVIWVCGSAGHALWVGWLRKKTTIKVVRDSSLNAGYDPRPAAFEENIDAT